MVEVTDRLFAFGCSFTKYRWMTWADILGTQYNEYYNWGQSGAGNLYIFNSIMEADQRYQFTANDTVIVCWTDIMREDRYVGSRWLTLGNIGLNKIYTKEFIADLACERGNLIRDIALIKGAKDLLCSRDGLTWKFISMCPLTQPSPWDERKIACHDVVNLYQDILNNIHTSFLEVLGHQYWEKDKELRYYNIEGRLDYHPTTQEHLRYLNVVLPNWVTNQSLINQIASTPLVMLKGEDGSCRESRL